MNVQGVYNITSNSEKNLVCHVLSTIKVINLQYLKATTLSKHSLSQQNNTMSNIRSIITYFFEHCLKQEDVGKEKLFFRHRRMQSVEWRL